MLQILTLFYGIVYLNLLQVTYTVVGMFWFVSVLPEYVTVLSPQVSKETHSKTCLLLYLVYYIFVHGVNKGLNTCTSWNMPVNLNMYLYAFFVCYHACSFLCACVYVRMLMKWSFSFIAWKILTYRVCCCFEINVGVSWCRPTVDAGLEKVSSKVTI